MTFHQRNGGLHWQIVRSEPQRRKRKQRRGGVHCPPSRNSVGGTHRGSVHVSFLFLKFLLSFARRERRAALFALITYLSRSWSSGSCQLGVGAEWKSVRPWTWIYADQQSVLLQRLPVPPEGHWICKQTLAREGFGRLDTGWRAFWVPDGSSA